MDEICGAISIKGLCPQVTLRIVASKSLEDFTLVIVFDSLRDDGET